jgi:hypothetical protein
VLKLVLARFALLAPYMEILSAIPSGPRHHWLDMPRVYNTHTPMVHPSIRYHQLSLRTPARSSLRNTNKGRDMTSPEKSRKGERESPQHHRSRRDDQLVYRVLGVNVNTCAMSQAAGSHSNSRRAVIDINERCTMSELKLTVAGIACVAVNHGLRVVATSGRDTW